MSDCIVYRKDVVEALCQALRTQFQGTFTDSMSLAMSMAKALPSARKIGRWMKRESWKDVPTVCSECKHEFTEYVDGYEWEETGDLPNYCPHCGAKMEGEKDRIQVGDEVYHSDEKYPRIVMEISGKRVIQMTQTGKFVTDK